ncbi:E3 ubiquitin protein ligase DRIP2 [Linum grandiflorum]
MAEIQTMKVNRKALKACLTCRICNKLLRQPTTISLCLHTFCKKCIHNRFSYPRVSTCPVCDVDLGCVPLDKLRRDHNLEDIRAKIFPLKGKKIKPSSEVITSISKPARRKQLSLSALASSVGEPSNAHRSNRNGDSDGVVAKREAANRTKPSKHNSPLQSLVGVELNSAETEIKSDSRVVQDSETYIVENESKEHDYGIKTPDDKNCVNPAPRMETMSDGLSASPKLTLNTTMNNADIHNCSVWLSLVATDENGSRNGNTSLPQIPTCYLRIKDSKMMVSSLQKYIVKKLQLSHEDEVEIRYKGRPVLPTAQLQNLVDLWLRNVTGKKVAAPPVGSSGKEFVLILSYCRRVQPS